MAGVAPAQQAAVRQYVDAATARARAAEEAAEKRSAALALKAGHRKHLNAADAAALKTAVSDWMLYVHALPEGWRVDRELLSEGAACPELPNLEGASTSELRKCWTALAGEKCITNNRPHLIGFVRSGVKFRSPQGRTVERRGLDMTAALEPAEGMDFSDITLTAADGGEVRAHCVVLAIASPWFESQIRMQRGVSGDGQISLTLHVADTVEALSCIVRILYSGKFDANCATAAMAARIVGVADYVCLSSIRAKALAVITAAGAIDDSSVGLVYSAASRYGIHEAMAAAKLYLDTNTPSGADWEDACIIHPGSGRPGALCAIGAWTCVYIYSNCTLTRTVPRSPRRAAAHRGHERHVRGGEAPSYGVGA